MDDSLNPQAEQMASEAMVRTLEAQAIAIWPQEEPLFERYALPPQARILDVGCGTGEISLRLARLYPSASVMGVDIDANHLEKGRSTATEMAGRVQFEVGNAFQLRFLSQTFDLVLCRHMLQAVPEPERVLEELLRVACPGGWLHILAEDYAMIHFADEGLDCDPFWHQGPITLGRETGTDLRIGRHCYRWLTRHGFTEIRVDYLTVDTLRVSREVFADIWRAWRDAYTEIIAEKTALTLAAVQGYWAQMLDVLASPTGYAVWHVPIISARAPR